MLPVVPEHLDSSTIATWVAASISLVAMVIPLYFVSS